MDGLAATVSIFIAISLSLLISYLNISPVDTCKLFNFFTKYLACVPLPAPGGPNNTMFTSTFQILFF